MRLDPSRLGVVGELCRSYVDAERMPFTMVQVAQDQEVLYHDLYGHAHIEEKRPITDDAIVRIYSMTKPIVSIALMQLVERGRVQLYDPVAKHLPALADLQVWDGGTKDEPKTRPAKRQPTIQDALTHQAGFTHGIIYEHPLDSLYRRSELGLLTPVDYDLTEFIERLGRLPLLFDPGEKWNYSVATIVCGAVVEAVSGQTLDRYLDEHIFGPLKMVDTGFSVREGQAQRFVDNTATTEIVNSLTGQPPSDTPDKLVTVDKAADSAYLKPPSLLSGGGGLVSTMADFQAFCDMLVAEGNYNGHQIIGSQTLATMHRNHIYGGKTIAETGQTFMGEVSTAGVGFGLGFATLTDPVENMSLGVVGEYSWGGAGSTVFWIDPTNKVSVIFYTQLFPSSRYPIRLQLRSAVNQALVS